MVSTPVNKVFNMTCYLIEDKYPLYNPHKLLLVCSIIGANIIMLLSVMLNCVVLAVFTKREKLQQPANIFIRNTCVSDAINGIISMPLFIVVLVLIVFYEEKLCWLYALSHFVSYLLAWVSFFMVFVIGMDRYLAVFKPYFYMAKIYQHFEIYYATCVIIWVISGLIIVSSFFVKGFLPALSFTLILPVFLAFSFYIHIKIWKKVKNINLVIYKQKNIITPINKTNNIRQQSKDIMERKTSKTTFLMLLSLCICYIPFYVLFISSLIVKNTNDYQHTMYVVCYVLVCLKSVINPLLYIYSMPTLRQGLYKIFKRDQNNNHYRDTVTSNVLRTTRNVVSVTS